METKVGRTSRFAGRFSNRSCAAKLQASTLAPRNANKESGFALLLVFAMAAILAVMLYTEMPRVVFEAQRNKEELLIERGEQYQRAIKVYFRTLNHYPLSIEQLEDTNHKRFLRRRYKDPMTGKDEWRLIHMGPGGFPTDSLTIKPPAPKKEGERGSETASGTTTGAAGTGASPSSTDASGQPVPNYAQRRGASDRGPMGVQQGAGAGEPGGDQGVEQPPPEDYQAGNSPEPPPPDAGEQAAGGGTAVPYSGQPPQPDQPQPGQPQQPGTQGQPGAPQPGFAVSGAIVQPGLGQPGAQQQGSPDQSRPPYPTQGIPVMAGPYGQNRPQPGFGSQSQQQLAGMVQNPVSTPAGGGGQGVTADNPGIRAIGDQLRNPTRGGINFPGNTTIGAGIAGVASKLEAEGIKSYNKHTKYNEWEFLYDPRKDPSSPWGRGAIPGAPGSPPVGFGSSGDTGKVGKTQ